MIIAIIVTKVTYQPFPLLKSRNFSRLFHLYYFLRVEIKPACFATTGFILNQINLFIYDFNTLL